MTEPFPLELRGLSVQYGRRVALREVDLDARRGEFIGLVGPNGSGKTTLLRAVLGLLPPASGTIRILGDPIGKLSVHERARRIAWVPQEESPTDEVSLIDYVLYGRYPYQRFLEPESDTDRALAEQLLLEVGLTDRALDGLLSLSGGERQRAVLARALAQATPLLLLDEPTSHLDIGHQLDMLTRVRELGRNRGITVVAAMHDLNLAARFADRIVVLARGRRVADGPPADVLSERLLREVWGVTAELQREPRTGMPYLIPRRLSDPASPSTSEPRIGPVHLVGGGGAAAPYLRLLSDGGFALSAGTLHLLDTDAEIAEALGIPTAVEAPFVPLGAEARARNRALLAEARAIVVAPFPVGPSNLANLEDLLPCVGRVPVYLIRRPPIAERDHSGGAATAAYARLVEAGAREIDGTPELEDLLRALAPTAGGRSPTGRGARVGGMR